MQTVNIYDELRYTVLIALLCFGALLITADFLYRHLAKLNFYADFARRQFSGRAVRILCLTVFTLFISANAWQCDDAYHSHVMSRNFADGFGLVYNIGERVSASTCPLWTIIVGAAYKIFGHIFLTSTALNILCSCAAAALLLRFACVRRREVIFSTAILLASTSFVSYTTSGLENSLLFLLFAIELVLFLRAPAEISTHRAFAISLIASFILMTRMDNALLIAPALFYILRNRTGGTSLLKTTSVLALGMLPFILWEVFSILYYGFPFPNTAYAKISSGFPQTDYLMRGAGYFFYTVLLDCITLLPPFALAILAWRKRLIKLLYISAGMFLYHVYLLKVGGDFMLGRHYTTMFFIAVFALSNTHANNLWTFDFAKKFSRPKTVFISFCAALLVFQSVIGAAHAWEPLWLWLGKKRFFTPTLRDERQRFFNYASLRARLRDYLDFRAGDKQAMGRINNVFAPWINHFEKLKTEEEKLRKNGITPRGDILHFAGGIHIYYLGGRRYLNDTFALGDPLLARLRGENYEGWLIGHVQRKIPAGYRDSVRTGRNVIADPQLHRYLDQLWLVTRSDDLLSPARLRAIFEFNTGQLRPSIN